ncbi:MAG: MEKHLA domain-containing protein, partial [Acidobacteria bacterium]|nr:MEKHLA domain-containing protein [Acidobacteriota bacterium]
MDEIAFAAEREVQLLEDLRHGEPLWGTLEELGDCLPTSFRQIAGKSLLLQPVFVWDRWWGVIGVSDHYEREWSVAEVEGLSTAAELLGAAITRQASEQALRESEQRYRSFFESATDLILSLAADGRFSYVNQAWRDTLGVSAAEVEDLKIFDFVAPEQRRVFENLFQRILAGEAVGQIETIFVSKHGSHVLVEGTFSTERSAGQTLSIRAIFRDITQRRRIERMKGEFVAIVSHELRTPLTSIHAGLRLLRQKHASRLSDSGQQLLELAHQNSYRLSALIDDIIDVERLDSGRLTFFLEDHVLTRLMAAAVDETQAFANRFGIAMAQRPATADYRVRVDGGRFVQVLKNLLTNAIKFSPKNGFVEVLAT